MGKFKELKVWQRAKDLAVYIYLGFRSLILAIFLFSHWIVRPTDESVQSSNPAMAGLRSRVHGRTPQRSRCSGTAQRSYWTIDRFINYKSY
jgi:hypothetical protein